MKISIITITYNSAATLPRALESVRSQTYGDIEHIIVDGASTDGTVDLIKAYADPPSLSPSLERVKSSARSDCRWPSVELPGVGSPVRWISEPDNGIYNALNKGIAMATGDVIGFLHSDDVFFSPDSIGQIAAAFESSGADVVYGDLEYRHGDKVVRRWRSNAFRRGDLKYGWMPPHPTVYVRREVYRQVGPYDEWFRISADYDMILRIFTAGYKTRYIPQVLVAMETGGASNRDAKARLSKTQEDYFVLKKNHVGAGLLTVACKQLRKIRQFLRQS